MPSAYIMPLVSIPSASESLQSYDAVSLRLPLQWFFLQLSHADSYKMGADGLLDLVAYKPSPHLLRSIFLSLSDPICLAKPTTHPPCSSLTIPLQPARSKLSMEDPSVFNFSHLAGGFCHRILLSVLQIGFLGEAT